MSTKSLVAMVSIYNSGNWLRRRLDNLFSTNIYKSDRLQIFCVNAMSPDPKDDEIAASYAGRPNYNYKIIDHCTVYQAWNNIIKESSSDYLVNANTDDLVSPECYDVLIDACEQTDSCLSHCDWICFSEAQSWSSINGQAGNGHPYSPPTYISCGHFPCWKRSLHDSVGLFDSSMFALGDADFWKRCWISGHQNFNYVGAPLAAYHWRGEDKNLWNRTPEDVRAREWEIIANRKPEKLIF